MSFLRTAAAARTTATTTFTARTFSTTRAAQLARMQIIGRLAAEPEVVATASGKDVVRYAVGTSYGPQDNRQTSWFRVASFEEGPRRDYLLSLPKGTLLHVEADGRMRVYDDAEGKKRTQLDLVQRSLEVLSRPRTASESEEGVAAAGSS